MLLCNVRALQEPDHGSCACRTARPRALVCSAVQDPNHGSCACVTARPDHGLSASAVQEPGGARSRRMRHAKGLSRAWLQSTHVRAERIGVFDREHKDINIDDVEVFV